MGDIFLAAGVVTPNEAFALTMTATVEDIRPDGGAIYPKINIDVEWKNREPVEVRAQFGHAEVRLEAGNREPLVGLATPLPWQTQCPQSWLTLKAAYSNSLWFPIQQELPGMILGTLIALLIALPAFRRMFK